MSKFVRILLSGFESASFPLSNKPIISPQNKMLVKKIVLFNKYNLDLGDKDNLFLKGMADINGAFFSGDAFPKIVGYAEFQDVGTTDESGLYIASGTHVGKFLDNQYFTDKFGREVQPVNEAKTFQSDQIYKLNSTYKDINYSISGSYASTDFDVKGGTSFQVTPPIIYRYNIYTGIYSGTDTLKGNFYFPDEFKVRFNKEIKYITTGTGTWEQDHLIVSEKTPSGGKIPGINVLQKIINENSGYVYIKETGLITGQFINFGLPRTGVYAKSVITGYVTGNVGISSKGIFIFNDVVTGQLFGPVLQLNATGYKNASNYLIYNKPNNFDSIIIENSIDDVVNTFTYSDQLGFDPPTYFNSIKTLNNIINSGTGYGVKSKIDQSNNLYLESTISGESGNLIKITSVGSSTKPTLEFGEYLIGGKSYYPGITTTGDFTGLFSGQTPILKYIEIPYEDFITGNINTIVGYRTFNDVNPMWSVTVSPNAISSLPLTNQKYKEYNKYKFTGEFIDDSSINTYNIIVGYNNRGNSSSEDISELKIKLNNGEIVTGIYLSNI